MLIGWYLLAEDYVLGTELRVVVQLAGEIESSVALPIAIAHQPFEDPHSLRRLGRIGPEPLYEGVLP